MTQTRFAEDSLLMSGTPEQRVVIAFSMIDVALIRDTIEQLFSRYLNWPWITMQAMHHRTLAMQWTALKQLNLVSGASRSGMPKNWIAYSEQLSRASLKRNTIWLERLEWIFEALQVAGIHAVCIKGSALIGDIYAPEARMLGDIDILVRSQDRKTVRDMLLTLGFQQGNFDPVTGAIEPLSREKRLFFTLHSHIMPKFTLALADADCPFLRLAVGFDFFDPGERHSYSSDAVISRRVRKSETSHLQVADAVDTVINLCAHIFREGTSATLGFAGDNWNLWKFSDLRSKLLQLDPFENVPVLEQRLEYAGLQRPFHFALHYMNRIYGDSALQPWFALCKPEEKPDYLYEMVDGNRRVRYDKPFVEQLFDTGRAEIPGLEPVWSKVMSDGEWW